MDKNTCTRIKLGKGEMHLYECGKLRLHAYKTNDFMDDEVFLLEKDGRAVAIESPCFFDNNRELEAYNPELLKRPQVIAANKMDAVYAEEDTEIILDELRNEFEPKGIRVFPISAVSRQGVKELLYHINDLLKTVDDAPVVFEKEFEVQYQGDRNLPYTVTRADDGAYVVEGPRIDKMLGYTNLDSEKGFDFFQKFLKNTGVLDDLEKAGIEEGDTVRMYGLEFDYYK